MWKFTASKYKNASPKVIKREECITGLPSGDLPQTFSSLASASSQHLIFNTPSTAGGSIGILPLSTEGRIDNRLPLLHAHSGPVTDLAFNPFLDPVFVTGSEDCTIKLWRLPSDSLDVSSINTTLTLKGLGGKVDRVLWHTTTDCLLTVGSQSIVRLYDVTNQSDQILTELGCHGDRIQSMSWSQDGRHLFTTCKDKKIRMLDPRGRGTPIEAAGHQNIKESWITCLRDANYVITTGFNAMRDREVSLRDVRNNCAPVKTDSTGTSTGALIPFYDCDTDMLFLVGKGDTCIRFWEVSYKAPFLSEASLYQLDQILGAALIPKLSLDVMRCEVNRLMVLSKNIITPVSYYVPRKSYTEFHGDLYPDTRSSLPACTPEEWMKGDTKEVSKVSMNPADRPSTTDPVPSKSTSSRSEDRPCKQKDTPLDKQEEPEATRPFSSKPLSPISPQASQAGTSGKPVIPYKPSVKVLAGRRECKLRHLKGDVIAHNQIFNLKNINQSLPWESDMFDCNPQYCAVPLGGSAGLVAVLKLSETGRLPDGSLPAVQNGSSVTDFVFDPFQESRLAVGCEDAKIKIWIIPEGGIKETLTDPQRVLKGHTEKIYLIRFNPTVEGVLVSASYDLSVLVWDVDNEEQLYRLNGHTDTIFCVSWDQTGQKCATACKDKKIRVYDVQGNTEPIMVGPGPEGTRGARIVWVLDNNLLLVTGFNRGSSRTITLYNATDLQPLTTLTLSTSTSVLIPHYDEDTHTVLLTGRGDCNVSCYEVGLESPHLYELSDYKTSTQYQAFAYLPKLVVDVRAVEFKRAVQLSKNTIDTVSFTVPRVKAEYFQDDIFVKTRQTWRPQTTCAEWLLTGASGTPQYMDLCPSDMKRLSQAPKEAPRASKYDFNKEVVNHKTDEDIKDDFLRNLSDKMDLDKQTLPQDDFEGCDEDEWDD